MMSSTSDNEARWLFTPDKLSLTPSTKRGMTIQEELAHRQTAACLIRKIGLKLKESCKRPSGLCIDTAMVYMHRFYMFHSFQKYPAHVMAPCTLFLAAKVEETPIKLEYVIKTTHMIKDPNAPSLTDKVYEELQQELITNENLLLQTLGFDLIVAHPHTSVITCGDLVGAPKTVTKLAYELATNSLHFTTMCLRYKPTTVACICLHMAFKRFSLSIPQSKEGKDWWNYLDPNLKFETIDEVTKEFVAVIEKCRKAFNKWVSVKNQQPESVEGKLGAGNCGASANSSTSVARATGSNSSK